MTRTTTQGGRAIERIRVGGLGVLGLLAVLAFVVAPVDGRFARVPVMVLCAVVAVIWHLAVGGPHLAVPAEPVPADMGRQDTRPPPSSTPSPSHRPGYFELDATEDRHLSLAAIGAGPSTDGKAPPAAAALSVDTLRPDDTAVDEVIDLTDPVDVELDLTDAPPVIDLATRQRQTDIVGAEQDPWLAFAASMFSSD